MAGLTRLTCPGSVFLRKKQSFSGGKAAYVSVRRSLFLEDKTRAPPVPIAGTPMPSLRSGVDICNVFETAKGPENCPDNDTDQEKVQNVLT